jgi:guanosine-3',5'-bis(diphosphate) 3'-pyrophosphohydrolase
MDTIFKQYPRIPRTLSLIKLAHSGQLYNELPYWHHPVRVMLRLGWFQVDEEILCAALLHDTLEDTLLTEQDLRYFDYSDRTIDTVKILTRDPELSYKDYIRSVLNTKNISAIRIKLADLFENSNNIRFLPPEKRGRMVRYGKSIQDILHSDVVGTNQQILIAISKVISGELERTEVEKWIGECPRFV